MIPLPIYTPLYYNLLLIVIIFACLKLITKNSVLNFTTTTISLNVFFVFILFYIGLRPISYYFVDMLTYNNMFLEYADGAAIRTDKDILWQYFMYYCSQIMSSSSFFLLVAFLYTYPLFVASKRFIKLNPYYLFLAIVVSFSFWAYGTNGMRNGIATSIFILALSFSNNKIVQIVLFTMSFFTHSAMVVPIAAYITSIIFNKPKLFFYGWLAAIPLSLILGGFWENFFISLGFDDRAENYLDTDSIYNQFESTGFRWDFVIYSASSVYAAYYYVIRCKFRDSVYLKIVKIYLTANAFWILIIRANFSNRFAYLSWFLMALVIFYPLLKQNFFYNHEKKLAVILFSYFGFTYVMNFIIPNF